jgi:hypothetical protein
MNGGFLGWSLIIFFLTLISGAPLWGAVGFALVSGVAGNIDRRMIRGGHMKQGLPVHPWL